METNNIDLLEAYVNGMLTAEEQIQVENRLRTDDSFKEDFEMYRLMVMAISENRKAELKSYITKNVKIKPVQFFRTPTFYAAAAASVVLCILSYFVIYKKLSEQNSIAQTENVKSKNESNMSQNPDSVKPVANDSRINEKQAQPVIASGNSSNVPTQSGAMGSDDSQKMHNEGGKKQTDNVTDLSSKPDDVKVEGDKMISDSFLFISRKIYIPKPKQYQSSPEDLYAVISTADPLKIEVQFWESPINYSGYRYYRNLLMIYGNYDPSLASFQELKDIVYMKYKNDYFKLSANESYTGMKKETDPKIIADLELKEKK